MFQIKMWFIYILLIGLLAATITLGILYGNEKSNNEDVQNKIIPLDDSLKTNGTKKFDLLFAQNVFIPHESYLEPNINALKSLETFGSYHLEPDKATLKNIGKYDPEHLVDTRIVTIHVVCAGWAFTDELWEKFKKAWSSLQSSVKIIFLEAQRLDHNFGQSRSWNTCIDVFERKFDKFPDYIILNGCDTYIPNPASTYFENAVKFMESQQDFGCLALDMLINYNTHWSTNHWKSRTLITSNYPYHEVKVIHHDLQQGGIATSISVVSGKVLQEIGGRFTERGVYSSDDDKFHVRLANYGYHTGIIVNNWITHPQLQKQSCDEFQKWKDESLARSNQLDQENMSEEELIQWSDKSIEIFNSWV